MSSFNSGYSVANGFIVRAYCGLNVGIICSMICNASSCDLAYAFNWKFIVYGTGVKNFCLLVASPVEEVVVKFPTLRKCLVRSDAIEVISKDNLGSIIASWVSSDKPGFSLIPSRFYRALF